MTRKYCKDRQGERREGETRKERKGKKERKTRREKKSKKRMGEGREVEKK